MDVNSRLAAESMRNFTAAHINYVSTLLVLLHNPEVDRIKLVLYLYKSLSMFLVLLFKNKTAYSL